MVWTGEFVLKNRTFGCRREVGTLLCWAESKDNKFPIRYLHSSFTRGYRNPLSFNIFWWTWALVKVDLFAQEASWVRFLTLDWLKMSGWNIPIGVICEKEEIIYHLLLLFTKGGYGTWFTPLSQSSMFFFLMLGGNLLSWHDSFMGEKQKKP